MCDLRSIAESGPIRTNKIGLAIFWPFFKNMKKLREREFSKLFIPAPISLLKKLVKFIYCDFIKINDIQEGANLLLLSTVCDFSSLRDTCVAKIFTDWN